MCDSLNSESEERKITMKKFVSLVLCAALLVSVCVSSATAVGAEEGVSTFNLDKIDPQMSLLDALEQYPEIYDIFYIEKITAEQAETRQADGVRPINTINGNEVPASILYSLNARKVPINTAFPSPHGSSQNGPWPYEQVNGTTANCYGYALGIKQWPQTP